MPQQQPQPSQQSKKKKGRPPAHQNKFAFRHNPGSKRTESILNLPNQYTCRRCHDKIEWRKSYRKYKPRTVVGKCNLCQQKRIRNAYHTICPPCTSNSKKAMEFLEQWNQNNNKVTRVCAICVQEPALPDPQPEGEEIVVTGKMSLRQRKTFERKLERKQQKGGEAADDTDDDSDTNNDESSAFVPENQVDNSNDGVEDDDPLVAAVGGADKLLTGEAYQQSMLAAAVATQTLSLSDANKQPTE